MLDIINSIQENITKDRRIPTKTLLTLNPSSQVCYTDSNQQIGSCLRQVWLDKTDQPKTNQISSGAIMAGFSGNWWEEWFINQLKEIGLYYNSNVPFTDVSRIVKGLVDVIIKNPNTNQLELLELKTYDASNYQNASLILGNSKVKPKPRDKHLLQAFRYSLIGRENNFEVNNLIYIDRACGGFYKNKQFKIELITINNIVYPKISTVHLGEHYEYVDTRISDVGVYKAEELLLNFIGANQIPEKEFIEVYSDDLVQSNYSSGLIPEYLYTKWKRDPKNNPLGDFQCKYCPFSNGTCSSWE